MATTFPTAPAVSALLTSAGQSLGAIDVAAPLAATIADWENATGWKPFFAAGSNVRYYNAPEDGVLELPGYSAITAVAVGVTYGGDGVATSGLELVENSGYFACHWHDDLQAPVTALEFAPHLRDGYPCGHRHRRRSVRVTGTLGWAAVPDDVYEAILEEAAARVFASSQAAQSGGAAKVTIGGRSLEFDSNGAAGGWRDAFGRAAGLYLRTVIA